VALVHHPLALETGLLPHDAHALAASERMALAHAAHVIVTSPTTGDALVADYSGDVAYAVRALHRALAIDPMHAFSHEVLGRIEIEAFVGATSRLHLVHALDKRRLGGLTLIARELFFQGKLDDALRLLDDVDRERPATNESFALRSRLALWMRDGSAIAVAIERSEGSRSRVAQFMARALRLVSSGGSFDELTSLGATLSRSATTPKRKAYLLQLLTEVASVVGQPIAERLVLSAANLPLSDLRWLDACPALDPVRGSAGFRLARAAVADRLERAFPGVSTGASAP
jgi:serine/threonine-protein kinase